MRVRQEKGFTLLETLVAFSILSVSMTIFYQVASTSLNRQQQTEQENIALNLAQSQLARVPEEIPLQPATFSGTWQEDFSWTIFIEPQPDLDSDHWLYNVTTQVVWDQANSPKQITLATVMVGAKVEQP